MKFKNIFCTILISVIVSVLVNIIMFFPQKEVFKDGGTVRYSALLWSYTDYHQMTDEVDDEGNIIYYEDQVFEIFPNNWKD